MQSEKAYYRRIAGFFNAGRPVSYTHLDKGRVNNGAYVQKDNYGMTEAMRRIIAYGYNTTNSLGKNDWYSDATAKTMSHSILSGWHPKAILP